MIICSLSSCKKAEKTMLEGNVDNITIVELNATELENKISNEESFVLIVLLPFCSSCENFKNQVINPFILETKATIYGISSTELNDENNYKNKPSYKYAPCILIYKNGVNVDKINYSETKDVFNDKEAFAKHIDKYFYLPKILEVSEETLDAKLVNKDNFLLYIGWNKCGDCNKIRTRVLDDYLLKEKSEQYIYYLEVDKYRINRPLVEPTLDPNATETEKQKYNTDKANWDNWVSFAKKYNFYDYNSGKVPTIQYYENGSLKDMIVYLNDVIVDDVIIDSFQKDLIDKNINDVNIDEFHNLKLKEFLNKYYKKA